MENEITFRWINGFEASQEDWDRIENIMLARGWMKLNPNTSRILVAEKDGAIAGFVCLQLVPHVEPLFVAPSFRGTGLAETLSDKLIAFMHESAARGWMAVASDSTVAKLCEKQGMHKIESPVYVYVEGQ